MLLLTASRSRKFSIIINAIRISTASYLLATTLPCCDHLAAVVNNLIHPFQPKDENANDNGDDNESMMMMMMMVMVQ